MSTTTPIRSVMSPGRYVQGPGAMSRLGEFLAAIGSTPLIVADDVVWGFVGHDVESSVREPNLLVRRERFGDSPSAKEIDRLTAVIADAKVDVVVAVGGGTIDAVKASGFLAGIRWATVLTDASTETPISCSSIPSSSPTPPRSSSRRGRRCPRDLARSASDLSLELGDHSGWPADFRWLAKRNWMSLLNFIGTFSVR